MRDDLSTPPPGYTRGPEKWASLSEAQRATIWRVHHAWVAGVANAKRRAENPYRRYGYSAKVRP